MKTLLMLVIGVGLICTSHAAQTNEPPATAAPMLQTTNAVASNYPTNQLFNAITATNIAQWKASISNLKRSPGLSEYWDMELTNRGASIPVMLSKNGQIIFYGANFVDISVKNETGDIMEVEMHSPRMNIDEARLLGLQLCKLLGLDPKNFLDWCSKVGNKWLDAPLYKSGGRQYSFNVLRTYNDERPWYINFIITPNP